jgi:mono/diheme cytochrome c family protein
MDCAGCHNMGSFSPKPEAGHLQGGTVGFEVPGLGVFWPPNLTPHPNAGLGRWSEPESVAALKRGKRPDGRQLAPAMPWPAYAALTDGDARAIAAYLKSLPPSDRRVPNPTQPITASAPYLTVKAPGQ